MHKRAWLMVAAGLLVAFSSEQVPGGGGGDIKPTNLDKLNTDSDEDDPFPSPDNITLLYARKVNGTFDIYLSQRDSPTKAWPAGKAYIASKDYDERTPFFHKGTGMLYFAMNKLPDGTAEEDKNFDLVRKIGETAPIPLQVISTPQHELGPWITPAGKEFYFSRETDKGWVLYVADGPKPGPIGNAKPVGFPPDFHRATISESGKLMYLQGPIAEGKSGIFRSRRAKVGEAWSKPEPVAGLSHREAKRGDMSPSLSADSTRLYFASDRPGGKGGLDLWSVLTAQLK